MMKLKCLQSVAGATSSYVPGHVYEFEPEEAEKWNDGVRFCEDNPVKPDVPAKEKRVSKA